DRPAQYVGLTGYAVELRVECFIVDEAASCPACDRPLSCPDHWFVTCECRARRVTQILVGAGKCCGRCCIELNRDVVRRRSANVHRTSHCPEQCIGRAGYTVEYCRRRSRIYKASTGTRGDAPLTRSNHRRVARQCYGCCAGSLISSRKCGRRVLVEPDPNFIKAVGADAVRDRPAQYIRLTGYTVELRVECFIVDEAASGTACDRPLSCADHRFVPGECRARRVTQILVGAGNRCRRCCIEL